jgi:hypothetical protein
MLDIKLKATREAFMEEKVSNVKIFLFTFRHVEGVP